MTPEGCSGEDLRDAVAVINKQVGKGVYILFMVDSLRDSVFAGKLST